MRRDCSTCANMGKKTCRTMVIIPKEKWCFATIEDAIRAERDIVKFLLEEKKDDRHMEKTLIMCKKIIGKLKEKREQQKREQI